MKIEKINSNKDKKFLYQSKYVIFFCLFTFFRWAEATDKPISSCATFVPGSSNASLENGNYQEEQLKLLFTAHEPESERKYVQAYMSEFVDRDRSFGQKMRENSAEVWLQLFLKAKAELEQGQDDFSYEPHRVILERLIKDFTFRRDRKYGGQFASQMDELKGEAQSLLAFYPNGNPPYRRTHRFIMFKVLPFYDKILAMRHPDVVINKFHQIHAESQFESYMQAAPKLLLSYSFLLWGDQFFIYSRPALHRQIGINLRGLDDGMDVPYADKFPMSISEFAWHDFGHVEFEAMRDLDFILSEGKDIVRVVFEWEYTKNRIRKLVLQVRERDTDLADALERLLMEMMHERGFNFSLSVMKQELETQKWIDIIMRKHRAGFYAYYPVNEIQFERLEEARSLLMSVIKRYKNQDQLDWIHTLRGDFVPIHLTYNPPLGYQKDSLQFVDIRGRENISFRAQQMSDVDIPLLEFVSAQVEVTDQSPFTPEVHEAITNILWAIENKKAIHYHGEEHLPVSLRIFPDHSISVMTAGEKSLPLELIRVDFPVNAERPAELRDLYFFKMNQILGAEDRHQPIAFIVRSKMQKLIGRVQTQQDLLTGLYSVILTTLEGRQFIFDLSDVRIDPIDESI